MVCGLLYQMEGDAQQACVALEKALALDPMNSQCRQLFELACSCFADLLRVSLDERP